MLCFSIAIRRYLTGKGAATIELEANEPAAHQIGLAVQRRPRAGRRRLGEIPVL